VSESNNVIEMRNVGIRYDQGPEILSNIKLSLPKGSFHFLTGQSGAGKTSLLSLMYLAQKPSRGQISVFNHNLNFTNRDQLATLRRRIGVVFQDFRLLDHLTAFDNVALPLRVAGMDERETKKRVTELLTWVELADHMYDKASTLSGGEKQRVAIARAVINRPDLLLADEPTGNVDNVIAGKLMKLFVELNKLGTTVVIATHSEKIIKDFAFPRLHLQNRALNIYYPSDVSLLGGLHV
jgi:cell division transport system ATP-binding protein